jgi:tetratricopeptide (TPR) repeat protein
MFKNTIILATIAIGLCACTKSAEDIRKEAETLTSANDIAGAEKAYEDGLRAYPKDENLTWGLLQLYQNSQQWDKFETFLNVSSSWASDSIASNFDNKLATHYFKKEDFAKARDLYMAAGDSNLKMKVYGQELLCNSLAAEDYHNAAAAAANVRDVAGVRSALEHLQKMLPNCPRGSRGEADITENVTEVQSMISKQE